MKNKKYLWFILTLVIFIIMELVIVFDLMAEVQKSQEEILRSLEPIFKEGANYCQSGKYEEGIKAFQKYIELSPPDNIHLSTVYDNIGIAHVYLNDMDKAIENFKKAISINPNFADPYAHLISAYLDKKDYASAISTCYDVFKIKSNVTRPHEQLFIIYGQIGRNYGYDKELILREVYHIEKILENVPNYNKKELVLQELNYLVSIEKDIEKMTEVSKTQRIFPKGISEISTKDFVANIAKEIKLPEDIISEQEKLGHFQKAKARVGN